MRKAEEKEAQQRELFLLPKVRQDELVTVM